MHIPIHPFTLPCTPPSPNLLTKPLALPATHPVIQPTLSPAPALQKIMAQRQCLALSTFQSPFMLYFTYMHQTWCYPRVHHFRNYLMSHSFISYIQCTNNSRGLSFQSTCRTHPLLWISSTHFGPSHHLLLCCISLLTGLPMGPSPHSSQS